MRLTDRQKNIIKKTVEIQFNHQATVKLFGSRTDDTLKGGDIDLLLEFNSHTQQVASQILRLNTELQKHLGAQKIDIIALMPNQTPNAVQKQALESGILL